MDHEITNLNGKENKTFITKLIVEMKNTFNKLEDETNSPDVECQKLDETNEGNVEEMSPSEEAIEEEVDDDKIRVAEIIEKPPEAIITKQESKESEVPKPRIVMRIKKNDSKRSRRKIQEATILKRSRRRKSRDGESVLQSAIARKEKSYNESNKPQRLTRQLKLTPKILENLEQVNKKVKNDRLEGKKHKLLLNNSKDKKKIKKYKRDEEEEEEEEEEEKERKVIKIDEDDSEKFITNEGGESIEPARSCLCLKKSNIYSLVDDKEIFCQALDCVGGKVVGCNNLVNTKEIPLTRPSQRVSYSLLCNVHMNRMYRHNRCPTCGLFCTQGTFVECEYKHHYHRKCQISVGKSDCCPHCGTPSVGRDVFITMYSSKRPVFLSKQRSSYPPAKMSFVGKYVVNRNGKESPLLPNDFVDYPIVPNGLRESYNAKEVIETILSEDYGRLARMLGSKNFKPTTPNGGNLLHFCAKRGDLTAIHMLITVGMEPDLLDEDQYTPLMAAVLSFKNDIVKYLIKAGADIHFKGTDGMTALHLSAQCGNVPACELLLRSATNPKKYVNACDNGGWTALVWACERSRPDVVRYLLSRGADPLVRDLKQNAALHWAAFSGSQDCVAPLLDRRCNADDANAQGDTALHVAARQGNYDAVVLLLLRGANTAAVNKLGENPLDCAQPNGRCYKVILLNMNLQSLTYSAKIKTIVSNDISNGRESNPIQCINALDDEEKPSDYTYISDYCLTSDIEIDKKITSLRSCTCEEDCNLAECLCAQNSSNSYDEDGRLIPEFNYLDPPLIFECNETCACNAVNCINRVVQRGVRWRFQLYKTASKGWGIKSLSTIRKGSFVCEYVGEIISDVEADQRADDSYLFDLDDRESETYCIDAKKYGNFSRFLNHSCDANLTPVKVFTAHQDLRFPRVAFFANRDVDRGEELCFDYGLKYWIVKGKVFTCRCESSNCRYSTDTLQETIENYKEQLREDLEEVV